MLHLVGISKEFNAEQAFHQARAHEKIRLAKGVYCDAKDFKDLPAFLRANALRIANFLYPNAVLTQASAYLKGMVEADGSTPVAPKFKLFLSGNYFRVTGVGPVVSKDSPMLEIVHFEGTDKGMKRFCEEYDDSREGDYKRMTLLCASDELVFLQNFSRRRGHLERFLSHDQMVVLRERLEGQYGEDLPARLSMIVQKTADMGAEFERAVQSLRTPIDEIKRKDEPSNLIELTLGWQRRPVAKLSNNGVNWSFSYLQNWSMPLQSQSGHVASIPAFISNLLPEGTMRDLLRSRLHAANATLLENSERFMSNLSIVKDPERLKHIPLDMLDGQLRSFVSPEGVFNGTVSGLPKFTNNLMREAADLLTSVDMLRIAGMQPKMLMNLAFDGELVPAMSQPATHILKFPGIERDTAAMKGVVEWASMTLAKGSGLECAEFSLILLKGDRDVLGYLTERFDIPRNEQDMRMIFAEDLCAALGYAPEAKGMPSLEQIIEVVKEVSTSLVTDMESLYQQITVNYLLENADFHAKNMSLIKVANPMLDGYRSVRMAPAYDIMRTASFAAVPMVGGEREPMQLGFSGPDGEFVDRQWAHDDFFDLGALCGLNTARSLEILKGCALGISKTALATSANLPAILRDEKFQPQMQRVLEILEHAVSHCHEFFPDLPASLNPSTKPSKTKSTFLARP